MLTASPVATNFLAWVSTTLRPAEIDLCTNDGTYISKGGR